MISKNMRALLLVMLLIFASNVLASSSFIEITPKNTAEYIEQNSNLESESESTTLFAHNLTPVYCGKSLIPSFKDKIYTFKSNNALFKPPILL